MRIENEYCFFWKTKYINNWHPCHFVMEFEFNLENMKNEKYEYHFNSSEQAFMFLKAMYFKDYEVAKKILKTVSQSTIQLLGREVQNFDNESWEKVREEKMYIANFNKFMYNKTTLLPILLLYKDYKMVEASPQDCIWGVGLEENDELIIEEKNWKGLNLLGKTLTLLTQDILNEFNRYPM